ncbi:MAG: radical SAM family heme chaperone HemW [Bacteroidetes bacterium]|nr:radical SAM family heme chaperone HemW [Bacteroidota bacterium]
MPGIYIHIPFCKQACNYCDFYFSTSLKNKDALLQALKKEIVIQKNYFPSPSDEDINTIYLGGGTPSLLTKQELLGIFNELNKYFSIAADAEITLEANPDDLTSEKIKQLHDTPINRLSIGVQSFFDEDLRFMNRAHTSQMAVDSVKTAQNNGFKNITIDLIYGTPTMSNENWLSNLNKAFELNVQHISCYALTVEPRTALHHSIMTGKSKNVDDEKTAQQFELLIAEMKRNDFTQYEISNFCKEGFYSRHNSNYWLKENYLGLGPSAHSYNGDSRQWNVRNNNLYIKALQESELNFEKEILTPDQQYNEYILTSLRTIWGIDLNRIKQYGENYLANCTKEAEAYIKSGDITLQDSRLYLTDKGKLLADKISSDLFVI